MGQINFGDTVQVAAELHGRGYTEAAKAMRKPGSRGRVIGRSDSHGLCFQVRHEDGTSAYYDPDEISLVGSQVTSPSLPG